MKNHEFSDSIAALKTGKLVVYPTDTLYALGADIYNDEAVKRVFLLKHRVLSQPIPVAVSSIQMMETLAFVDVRAEKLAHRFLPGALTFVLKKKKQTPSLVAGGRNTIAVRIPKNNIALHLLSEAGPLTTTSANRHGEQPASVIKEIQMQFDADDIAVYLDGGRLAGKPSTIVDLTTETPRILRSGVITLEEIEDAIHL